MAKHVGMIIDFIEDFLNLISACTGYVAPVMKHAVYGSGRDAGHACNVFYRIILVSIFSRPKVFKGLTFKT